MRRKLGRWVYINNLCAGHREIPKYRHTNTIYTYTNIFFLLSRFNCDSEDDTSVWILLTNAFCSVVLLRSTVQVSPTNRQSPVENK